jgi:hypothetical protein
VNTRTTSTDPDSSVGSGTTRRTSRRTTSKLALLRAKVATIVMAVVLFLGSLTGIAIYNPQVGNRTAMPAQAQQITIVEPDRSGSLLQVPPPRVDAVRPFVRSRGS